MYCFFTTAGHDDSKYLELGAGFGASLITGEAEYKSPDMAVLDGAEQRNKHRNWEGIFLDPPNIYVPLDLNNPGKNDGFKPWNYGL